ncbi:uncharacterized protein FIBRA_07518 [Fibroporia radiculosa]|uniref:Tyrosine specific protein phosphatases domain-containing protein n=1 Tax=Fibroporia radiculosa TaxID=599839 RepID=J4H4N6_9APHY|nr:uncharacterized protein FIBRA_07518 [Fibroporia radiculosa]CCM05304.1 predicted protein [Fibroporia radiculosa]
MDLPDLRNARRELGDATPALSGRNGPALHDEPGLGTKFGAGDDAPEPQTATQPPLSDREDTSSRTVTRKPSQPPADRPYLGNKARAPPHRASMFQSTTRTKGRDLALDLVATPLGNRLSSSRAARINSVRSRLPLHSRIMAVATYEISNPLLGHKPEPISLPLPAHTTFNSRTTAFRNRTRPIPNSYWATPYLVACEFPYCPITPAMLAHKHTKQKLDALLLAGVRTFIDLTEPHELFPYAPHLAARCALLGIDACEVEYHNFPIRDRNLPESVDFVRRIMDVLRDCECRARIAAVHCRGGIGRTGLIVGCWLVESGVAKDGAGALRMIAEEWKTVEKCKRFPCSPETGPQFEFVRSFQRSKRSNSPPSRLPPPPSPATSKSSVQASVFTQ